MRIFIIMTIFLPLFSCRTTQDQGPSRQSSVPSDIMAASSATNSKVTTDPLVFVVATPVGPAGSDGIRTWAVHVKSKGEVMCERQCSTFDLVESTNSGVSSLTARKITQVGNTLPARLDVSKAYVLDPTNVKDLQFGNVGSLGSPVLLLSAQLAAGRDNFYAVVMNISTTKDTSGQSIYRGTVAEADAGISNVKLVVDGSTTVTLPTNGEALVVGSLANQTFYVSRVLPLSE